MLHPLLILTILSILSGKCFSSSVIIIGAGPSGIAAATKLLGNDITNITILEAENRIGGRINSVKFGDSYVDLGAEFCHGMQGNVVYQMVRDMNLLEYNVFNDPARVYYSNGSRINDRLTQEMTDFLLTFNSNKTEYAGMSVGQLFKQKFNQGLLAKYKNNKDTLNVLLNGVPSAESFLLTVDGSYSWDTSSVAKHYQEAGGYQANAWNGRGYKTILQIMTKEFPDPSQKLNIDEKILLNKTVTKIDWTKEIVEVSTSDQSRYQADYVVFTPSVGVLKESHARLFEPALPSDKVTAIEQIGFDGVLKIIMHFPSKWWRDEDDIIAFIWSTEDLNDLETQFPNEHTWMRHINMFIRASNNSNVRITWVTGKVIEAIEATPLEIIRKRIAFVLNKFLAKDYRVEEPDQILRSTWVSNPNFRGTYSYEHVKYYKKNVYNQRTLGQPLRSANDIPIVLFAGEATSPKHYSTVHGAVEAGYREARRIITAEEDRDRRR